MSGPKNSRLEIERRKQEELERLRRIEQERKRRVNTLKNEIRQKLACFRKDSEEMGQYATEVKEFAQSNALTVPTELKSFIELKEFNNVKNSINYKTEDENLLKSYIETIQKKTAEFKDSKHIVSDCETKVKQAYTDKLMSENAILAEKIKAMQQAKQMQKQKDAENKDVRQRAEIINVAQKQFAVLCDDFSIDSAIRCRSLQSLKEFMVTANDKTISNQYLSNIFAVKYASLLKKLEDESTQYQNLLKRYNDTLVQYQTLCEEIGTEAKSLPVLEDSISYMQLEIIKLEDFAKRKLSHGYIQNAINEIMTEMGYKVLGNGKDTSYETKLYHFADDRAVQVTMDTNGSLTMELGKLDDTDRNADISEQKELQYDMQNFCSKYKVIKEKLEQKGIKLSNCEEYPPSVEYAQIFNVNDFDMDEELLESIASAENKQQGVHELKKMHIDNI